MSHTPSTVFLIAAMNCLSITVCFSQHDTTSLNAQRLILVDGSELIGNIVKEDSSSIGFRTISNILITIPKTQVRKIEDLSGYVTSGQYVRSDPNQTRLLFAPTARPLKSGQGYFSAYELFFPFLAVGVTDFLTAAGGITLFPGAPDQLFYLAPKVTPIQIANLDLAGGVLYMNSTGGGEDGFGIIYSVGTYGNQSASFTAGLGWGFYGSEIADKPVVMIGGELRASSSVKFITENWIPPNSDVAILSFGIRFYGEKLAADFGLIHFAGSRATGFPFLPWLGFAYNFGTTK